MVDATPPKGYEAQVFVGFLLFFVEKYVIFDAFCQLFVLLEASMRNIQYYGCPVRDVVNKNSTEPQAAHLKGIFVGLVVIA